MNGRIFGSGSNNNTSASQLARIICMCFLGTLFQSCTEPTGKAVFDDESMKVPANLATETRKIGAASSILEGKWSEIILPSRESLSAVQFATATSGWVGSTAGSLYRTEDGGVKWKRIALGNKRGNYLVSLHSIGDKSGWAVFSKYPSNYSDHSAYSARILHTEDGGETWSPQYERQQAAINRIRFNRDEGWAIGVSYDGNRTSHLILHTTNHGKHWEDVSQEFERAVNSPASHDFPIDIYSARSYHATVLTVGGRVMRSDDGGRDWRKIGRIEDEFQQTGFMRIGEFGNGSIWALGGADSKEGIWANFSVFSNDNSWTGYRTTQVFFRDAAFLANGGAVACGAVPDYQNPKKVTERRAAVISHSSDEGRSWSIVYRSDKARFLNALFVFDTNQIWAVGDKGLIVHLQNR